MTGYREITASQVDDYVYRLGSVLACLDWKGSVSNNCGDLHTVKPGVVFEGDRVEGGCNHAVLIVG